MNINSLEYYPRFVFNCSDSKCFSTADLDGLKFIKNDGFDGKVDSFQTGRKISILWNDGSSVVYRISKIDVRDIRYDTDEQLYGIYEDDCSGTWGQDKFHLISIFVFLDAIDE